MGGHLAEETMLALIEGDAGGAERAHAAECAHCRARPVRHDHCPGTRRTRSVGPR